VPRDEVDDAIADAMERFEVLELAADPPGWNAELDGWRETYGDVVIDYPTNERRRMSAACDRFCIAVLEGDLTHDGNAVLARHLGHCIAKDTPYGQIVTKDAPDSPRKIDCAVAAIVDYDRALWHAANTPERAQGYEARHSVLWERCPRPHVRGRPGATRGDADRRARATDRHWDDQRQGVQARRRQR
jgi:phage terminase large subunit-like protein